MILYARSIFSPGSHLLEILREKNIFRENPVEVRSFDGILLFFYFRHAYREKTLMTLLEFTLDMAIASYNKKETPIDGEVEYFIHCLPQYRKLLPVCKN